MKGNCQNCQNCQDCQDRRDSEGIRKCWQFWQSWQCWQCCQCAWLLLGLLIVVSAAPAFANNRYDPRLRFHTLSTEHFDIHFHQQEDDQARRLAAIAEEVSAMLASTLGRPDSRVHVILVNQTDLANGWATPVPYNVMELTAAAPGGDSTIGNTDDWLRLVFTHEYTHVVHLSRRRGWLGGLHRVFGRLPLAYPNLFLPTWQIEGIAVFEESARTGAGRISAPDFRQIVDRAAAEGRFEPLDRTNGGLIAWPSGGAPYAYGGYFQQYLAARYGEASLRRLTDETAGRLPYFGSLAYKKVFGRSLGDLWRDFRDESRRNAIPEAMTATRVTRHGFNVDALRFGAGGRLFYSVANPHGFPALMEASADGARQRRVITRFLGNRTAVSGRVLVFDQLELVNNVALQSDLYAVDAEGGPVRRLTRGAHAGDPDVSSDGSTIVCTVQQAGRRELATMPFSTGEHRRFTPATLVSEADTDYSAPRWSPDGRWIAAERRRPGARSEIVVIDPRTREIRVVASTPGHRSVTPAWMPDSSHVLFASDEGAGPFRIFRVDLSTGLVLRLEGTGSASVRAPDASPDGSRLAFIGYTTGGYDVFTMDLTSARWTPAEVHIRLKPDATTDPVRLKPDATTDPVRLKPDATTDPVRLKPDTTIGGSTTSTVRAYAPWRTLAPTFWTPSIESDDEELVVGAATGAADVLGRQGYAAQAGWSSSRARPDWRVAYAYDRWRPTLFVDLSDDTDPFRSGEVRSREADVGLLLPFRQVRWSQTFFAAWNASTDTIDCASCRPVLNLRAARRSVRAGWNIDNSKSYGYSISAEHGGRVIATTELTRHALGADADAGSATIDARGYLPVVPRHAVVAARVGAAAAWGDGRVRRVFSASGAGPQSSGFEFGTDAIGLLRGFAEDDVTGEHAWAANLDYRVPLLRVERGAGTLPLFLRTVHAALFADAGDAWTSPSRSHDVRASAGIELSLDTVLGYGVPLTFTGGAAWRHDPTGRQNGVAVFARVGRAF
jgi:Tol biopolymer transport system component/phenylpyruvate tautomerase PptA (4-oxalocrotonate tautomerase family)